ncbi:hypothetical protein AB0K48_60870, partial [Nonomuraea sp. NPDC055795]
RRKWFTAAQFAAFQVVQAGVGATSSWVIVDGYLLGTVGPHRTATGGRSGWDARHRGGSRAPALKAAAPGPPPSPT